MVFDRLFKNFKKDKPADDFGNMTVLDLEVGCFFDYDLSTWKIDEEYEYDWGDQEFSREFKVTNGVDVRFLSIEEDDGIYMEFTQKINLKKIDSTLYSYLISSDEVKPPAHLTYEGKKYFLDEEAPGYYRNVMDGDEWTEFISWTYYDDSEENVLTIEQWGDTSFDASQGKVIKEFQISNLLPNSEN